MKWPNGLNWYITPGWKGVPGTNMLSYWGHSLVKKKMKCCDYSYRGLTNGSNELNCYIALSQKGTPGTILLGPK
jgi:hypothetical protein